MQESWTRARDYARDSRTMEVAPSLSVRPQTSLRPSALIPVGTYRATLTVIRGSDTGRLVAIGRNGLVVGSAPDADLVVDGDGVSRYHARISADEGGTFHVEDLGSASGTFVGANQVSRSPLVTGDQVQFGRELRLRFRIIDATEKSTYGEVYEPSLHDELTRAFNRPHFFHRLFAEGAHARRAHTDVSVLMIGVDRLKELNDACGHLAGDRALSSIVGVIGSSIRVGNALARYDGDELALLAPLTNPRESTRLAERLLLAVAGLRLTAWGKNVHLTVSIGTASLSEVLPSSQEPHLELLSLANERLCEATRAERGAMFSGSVAPLRFRETL